MSRQFVGVLGCIAVAVAAALAGAVVFAEKAIIDAGIPYNFAYLSAGALALCGTAAAFGLGSRATRAGKVALVGGTSLGVLFLAFVLLVSAAFS